MLAVWASLPTENMPENPKSQQSPMWRCGVVICVGGFSLLAGIIMLVPPTGGRFHSLGLAILTSEFRWAKNLVVRIRGLIRPRRPNKSTE
jgi:putative transmembrane protein PGPGW